MRQLSECLDFSWPPFGRLVLVICYKFTIIVEILSSSSFAVPTVSSMCRASSYFRTSNCFWMCSLVSRVRFTDHNKITQSSSSESTDSNPESETSRNRSTHILSKFISCSSRWISTNFQREISQIGIRESPKISGGFAPGPQGAPLK